MGRVVREFGPVLFRGVFSVYSGKSVDWLVERMPCIGREGWLNLCERDNDPAGRQFLYFFGGEESEKDWSLQTCSGDLDIAGKVISFTTHAGRYEFEIL